MDQVYGYGLLTAMGLAAMLVALMTVAQYRRVKKELSPGSVALGLVELRRWTSHTSRQRSAHDAIRGFRDTVESLQAQSDARTLSYPLKALSITLIAAEEQGEKLKKAMRERFAGEAAAVVIHGCVDQLYSAYERRNESAAYDSIQTLVHALMPAPGSPLLVAELKVDLQDAAQRLHAEGVSPARSVINKWPPASVMTLPYHLIPPLLVIRKLLIRYEDDPVVSGRTDLDALFRTRMAQLMADASTTLSAEPSLELWDVVRAAWPDFDHLFSSFI